jgi:hypothetical protein
LGWGNGGKGIRTPGLLIANETLYQLSYTPVFGERRLARFVDFSSSESGLDPSVRNSRTVPASILIVRATRKNDCRERFRV